MFPFSHRSLTHAIDAEIHHFVRKASPYKYLCFRLAELASKLGIWIATLAIFFHLLLSLTWIPANSLSRPASDAIEHSMALWIISGVSFTVIGDIVREGLFKDLEAIARGVLKST